MQIEPTTKASTSTGWTPSRGRDLTTTTRHSTKLRKRLFAGAIAIIPAAIGSAIGVMMRSKRAGALAGGMAAGALALARWQLKRFIIDEPAYEVERRVGEVEVRAYEPFVMVRTVIQDADVVAAKQAAFDRLDRYLDPRDIKMIAPFQLSRDGDGHAMTFVMPPGRSVATLPRPEDESIRVMEAPARRIAALPYPGTYDREAVAEREQELLRLVANAGLTTKGPPIFAGFDPPNTVSFLRRNEIWIEIV
jgi:hypothetical protein